MKSKAIIALVLLALVIGIVAYMNTGKEPKANLVPAWQLTPPNAYSAMQLTDPMISWSPDSKAVLVSVRSYMADAQLVMGWRVGDKRMYEIIKGGTSANFSPDGNGFLYLKLNPKAIYKYDFATGKENEVYPNVKKSDIWSDVSAFIYLPKQNALALRYVEYTQYELPGTELVDVNGKSLGIINDKPVDDAVDCSASPDESKNACLVQAGQTSPASLAIFKKGQEKANAIDTGDLGAVAWSPNGKLIAYGSKTDVIIIGPDGNNKTVIGRFAAPLNKPDLRYVSRLWWSPNGKYLAVLVYVPGEMGDYPLIYVLNMSEYNKGQ